ncbi:MAG: hypothetical protein IPO93_04685 [Actinobacteria bacterium]|nr:hypothetical protein [Actinomycetota bacterium]
MTRDVLDDRSVAVATYNRCWDLLESEQRSPEDDADLLMCALTSRYHWQRCGGDEQRVVADWMVSRAAAAIGQADLAVRFAERALDAVQRGAHPAWLRASVFEGLARAHAALGDTALCDRYASIARLVLDREPDEANREVVAEQLRSLTAARDPSSEG